MSEKTITFIAHQDQENLGVGYMASMLLSKGFNVENVDFSLNEMEISKEVKKANPFILGFSLIFQYHFFKLRELAKYLRDDGVLCHFTVGGHYPSLRYNDVLEGIPEIDSVVRFEGEHTMYELAENLKSGRSWTETEGLAYRKDGKPVSNKLRPLIDDLDTLPIPLRINIDKYQCMGKKYTHIIASRGCIRNCAFCSINKFYGTPPGRIRRSRSPENVINEMKKLYDLNEIRIFFFQDDDFILPGRIGRKWLFDYADLLKRNGLENDVLWKINCRSDDVDPGLFKMLKNVGLFSVYLGIESGTQAGLDYFNKQLSVEDNVKAIKALKKLDIYYDFGFMLFHPSSTFNSIDQNIRFLREMCGDGSSPSFLGKTAPYAETEIEKQLSSEGRLKGFITAPDYTFLDPRMDSFCDFLHKAMRQWMFSPEGLLSILRWHRFEVAVLKKFYDNAIGLPEYEESLRHIVVLNNELFSTIVSRASKIFQDNDTNLESLLKELEEFQHEQYNTIYSKLHKGMIEFQKQQR